jgi:putative flippase GtrA
MTMSVFSTFGRHQVGALVATVVDFGTMTLLVSGLGATPVVGTVIGASAGAVTNFTMGRRWIFRSTASGPAPQAGRYAVVSGTSLILNALGEYVLSSRLGLQYQLARVIVAILVSILFNFPMQRYFVFRTRQRAHA